MKKSLLAAAVLGLSLSAPAFAQGYSDNATVSAALRNAPPAVAQHSVFSLPRTGRRPLAAAESPPILTDFISASPFVSNNLPCFNCVSTDPAPKNDVGLAIPLASYSPATTKLQYTLTFQDEDFTGTCTVAFAVVRGGKVLDSGTSSFPGLSPNLIGLLSFNRTRPTTPGPATLAGSLRCGTFTSNVVSEQLFFEPST